ncbi:BNR-4 repeat-containing protein [Paenarthrobacter sp. YJN-D]|uniref:BNR-4 repeat-containing protein n=1 Tax=Paenarthrobacter sp. YJN-D TaxID=2735317 RepID=UPI0021054970|nr:BNR-4 repeat-containing protein [Paenarthrobacter sp. YJN-D]
MSTGGGKRYAVWYNESGALIIGKRTLPNGAWTTFDLSTVAANPLVLPVDNDPHNSASIIVDAAGYIHVAANMHGDVLRYVRSTNPHDITAWTAPGMTGLNEAQMTYTRFALHPDGTVFFLYRDGASGFGDLFLNKERGRHGCVDAGGQAGRRQDHQREPVRVQVCDRAGRVIEPCDHVATQRRGR